MHCEQKSSVAEAGAKRRITNTSRTVESEAKACCSESIGAHYKRAVVAVAQEQFFRSTMPTSMLSPVAQKRRRAGGRFWNDAEQNVNRRNRISIDHVRNASPLQHPRLLTTALFTTTTIIVAMTHTAEAWAPPTRSGLVPSSSTTALQMAVRTRAAVIISENHPTPGAWRVDGAEPLLLENYEASLFASDYDYDDEDDEDYLLDDEEMDLIGALDTVQKLQQQRGGTGPNRDVLSTQEQALVDQSDAADVFLENFGGADASRMEKIAMGSIPAQLPQAPLVAFLDKKTKKTTTTTKKTPQSKNSLPYMYYSRERVSVEQEQQLGRLIQAGAKVVQIKEQLQVSLGREPTKHEWAKAAGFDSAKELRRTVAAYRTAKHLLVTANMGLVHSIVRQGRPQRGVTMEELIQEGSLGLLRAAELFDPAKGLRFSTYAVVWIKGMLANTHVAEFVKLPDRERTKWNRINQAAAALKAQDGSGTPSGEALAACTGLPLKDVMDVTQHMTQLQSQYWLSLDAPVIAHDRSGALGSSSQSLSQYETISYDDEGMAEQAQLRTDLIATLARNLTPREARLMRLRYGLTDGQSRSMQQCADAMGISIMAVKRLDKKCMERLREAADAKALEEYLLTIS
jgi:RNA polymerase sigma factor (sigma-70 family)